MLVQRGMRSTTARAAGSAVTTSAAFSAARLNAFDADVTEMPQRRAASETSRNGVYVAPGKVSAAWISSASTQASRAAQRSAIASSSARVRTRPVGLWGLASTSARAPAASAASSPSSSREPSASRPISINVTPASGSMLKNGGYAGVANATASPGAAITRHSSTSPIITSGTRTICSSSTSQFRRRAAKRVDERRSEGVAGFG